MIIGAKTWLRWAHYFASAERADMLRAMEVELSIIPSAAERNRFAYGCFASVVYDAVRSRRGLSYMARSIGAFLILVMCLAGGWIALKYPNSPEIISASKLIIGLCIFYSVSAGLLIISLRYLQIYAVGGFVLAVLGWLYCTTANPSFESLTIEFLKALSFEMAGFMAGLFIGAVYLNWLYNPELCDD